MEGLGHAVAATPLQLWLHVAILAAMGAVGVRLVVLPRWHRLAAALGCPLEATIAPAVRRALARALFAAGAFGALGALLRLVEQAGTLGEAALPADAGALEGLRAAFPVGALLGTRWGHAWAALLAAFLLVALAGHAARRAESAASDAARAPGAWGIAALGVAALAVAPPFLGHAAADETLPALSIAADVLHLAGAGAWLGALALVVAVALPAVARGHAGDGLAQRGALVALVRAYSPLALAASATLAASGVVSAALRLAPVWDVAAAGRRWETLGSYGLVLGWKLAAVLPTALLGFWHWRRALPVLLAEPASRLVAPAPDPDDDGPFALLTPAPRRLARTLTLEVACAALVLLATALLVGTAPPALPDPPVLGALSGA